MNSALKLDFILVVDYNKSPPPPPPPFTVVGAFRTTISLRVQYATHAFRIRNVSWGGANTTCVHTNNDPQRLVLSWIFVDGTHPRTRGRGNDGVFGGRDDTMEGKRRFSARFPLRMRRNPRAREHPSSPCDVLTRGVGVVLRSCTVFFSYEHVFTGTFIIIIRKI